MKNPAMTWRVRRIGRTFWSAIHSDNGTWLSVERARHSAVGGQNLTHRLAASIGPAVLIEPSFMSDGGHWLAALRLDRAALAVRREPS